MIYALLKITFAMFFSIVFRAKIEGRENMPNEGPVILAANHMSNWDPPLLATFLARPVSYMAKQELFFNFIADYILRSCHSFPVKRGAADRGAIKAALAELKKGRCLGVFPQGTERGSRRSRASRCSRPWQKLPSCPPPSSAPTMFSPMAASCRSFASFMENP